MGLKSVFSEKMKFNSWPIYSAPDGSGSVPIPEKNRFNINYKLELGLQGEQLVSDNLDTPHKHHNFNSLSDYYKSQENGADIWNEQFEFEVKNYPNSRLTSQSHYDLLVKPRFSWSVQIKGLVVLQGEISSSFISICNRDGITVIHIDDLKYLKSKLTYYLEKFKLLPKFTYSYTFRFEPHIDYTDYLSYGSSSSSNLSAILVRTGLGPPFRGGDSVKIDDTLSVRFSLLCDGGTEKEKEVVKMDDKIEFKEENINNIWVSSLNVRSGSLDENDSLKELAKDIQTKGIIQPIVVKRAEENPKKFQLVIGSRRLAAAKYLRKAKVPVIIKEMNDFDAICASLSENLHREDLTPLERATALKHLRERYPEKFPTLEALGKHFGITQERISQWLSVIDFPNEVKKYVNDKKLAFDTALKIHSLKDPAKEVALAKKAIAENWSQRKAQSEVGKYKLTYNERMPKITVDFNQYQKLMKDRYLEKLEKPKVKKGQFVKFRVEYVTFVKDVREVDGKWRIEIQE
jgi:ParB family chromosome partitioning protein